MTWWINSRVVDSPAELCHDGGMVHECQHCGIRHDHSSGQMVRRNGQWVCSSCYNRSIDGLFLSMPAVSQTTRESMLQRNDPVVKKVKKAKPATQVVPAVPAVILEPVKPLIGEPIFEDDEEFI